MIVLIPHHTTQHVRIALSRKPLPFLTTTAERQEAGNYNLRRFPFKPYLPARWDKSKHKPPFSLNIPQWYADQHTPNLSELDGKYKNNAILAMCKDFLMDWLHGRLKHGQ